MSKARVCTGEGSTSAPYSTRREKSRQLAQKRRDHYKEIMEDLTNVSQIEIHTQHAIPIRCRVGCVEGGGHVYNFIESTHIINTLHAQTLLNRMYAHAVFSLCVYSETSKQRTSWDQHGLSLIVLNREVSSFQRLNLH